MNCGVTKCVWQNGKTKSAHGVVKLTCTHLGCHVGEDFPCKNLLVASMTWTWSSWDRHRVYPGRWNCGVGDGSRCQTETQTHHHSTRIWSPMQEVTSSCLLESLRPHSGSGAFCDRSNSQPVPGPDGESRQWRFDCVQYCQHNAENTHRPMHIAGWISGIHALSSLPYSSSEWQKKDKVLNMVNNTKLNWTS